MKENLEGFEKALYEAMVLRRKWNRITLVGNFGLIALLVILLVTGLNSETWAIILILIGVALIIGLYIFKIVQIRKKMSFIRQKHSIKQKHEGKRGFEFVPKDVVEVEGESENFPGWYMCSSSKGRGYIHNRYLRKNKEGEVYLIGKFNTTELEVKINDKVEVIAYASAWVYVKNEKNEEGWILADCIDIKE